MMHVTVLYIRLIKRRMVRHTVTRPHIGEG